MSKSRLPGFFIGGAMKSGTSTLHYLLDRHPDAYLPKRELHFFSMDDVGQHPELAGRSAATWVRPHYERDFDTNLAWYAGHFAAAGPEQLTGEHATVYLSSPRAAARIADMLPDARLIFLLRDPVQRALSHYWHMVRSGRAIHGFEKTLRVAPHTILTRSFYREGLEHYLRYFPRDHILVLIFEEFINDISSEFRRVERFLSLPHALDLTGLPLHRHPGEAPRFPRLRLLENRVLRDATTPPPPGPESDTQPPRSQRVALRIAQALRVANPQVPRYPQPRPETVAYLQEIFARENAGLSGLIGVDVERYWPYMK
jgi:hypothetical protein